jgi:hypothetical protein
VLLTTAVLAMTGAPAAYANVAAPAPSTARSCKPAFYYPPTGYAIAIEFSRVAGASCSTARRVGRTYVGTGHGPRGWRCRPHPRGTRCTRRRATVVFHTESAG